MVELKCVLITGAGSGIGAEAAKIFSETGFHVFLLGRSTDKLEAVSAKLTGPSTILQCDLTNQESVNIAIKKLKSETKVLDVLVNNAGIVRYSSFLDSDESHWNEHFNGNLYSAFRVTKGCFELLKESSSASVINVSSTLGHEPIPNTSAYSASKAAMINWTSSLAGEWAPYGIRVNCVSPGIVNTPIHGFYGKDDPASKKMQKDGDALSPLGRMGEPIDIARSILHLAESQWTTGSTLVIDGGTHLLT